MKKIVLFTGFILCVGCGPNIHDNPLEDTSGSNFIVGGKVVENENFAQHIVAIYDARQSLWCTGTLISTDTILTAAHCVNHGSKYDYVIYFSKKPGAFRNDSRKVAALRFHAGYNAKAYEDRNDVAVLRIKGALPAGFAPMALPTANDLNEHDFYAAGYGTITARNEMPKTNGILRYTSQHLDGIKPEQTQFLVDQTNGHGICFGDSGGPAFTTHSRPAILGIASAVYTRNEQEKNKPGFDVCRYNAIYTSVFHYLDWIEKASADIH